jgi:hypothetical protein
MLSPLMQQLKYSTHINSGGDLGPFVLLHMVAWGESLHFGILGSLSYYQGIGSGKAGRRAGERTSSQLRGRRGLRLEYEVGPDKALIPQVNGEHFCCKFRPQLEPWML